MTMSDLSRDTNHVHSFCQISIVKMWWCNHTDFWASEGPKMWYMWYLCYINEKLWLSFLCHFLNYTDWICRSKVIKHFRTQLTFRWLSLRLKRVWGWWKVMCWWCCVLTLFLANFSPKCVTGSASVAFSTHSPIFVSPSRHTSPFPHLGNLGACWNKISQEKMQNYVFFQWHPKLCQAAALFFHSLKVLGLKQSIKYHLYSYNFMFLFFNLYCKSI